MSIITVTSHVELTVQRPNGDIDVVNHPKFKQINDNIFSQIVKGTKNAGKGDVLSYKNCTKTEEIIDELDGYSQALMDSLKVDKMSRMGE